MDRAYSLIALKAVDEEKRILRGIATTPSVDKMDDVVEPKGAEYTLPIPFLWQHDHRSPVGQVTKATVKSSGIEVEIQLSQTDEPGPLKDRLDTAWQEIKLGLVRGLSIGFKPLETARIEGSYGIRFIKWLWMELSGVTVAANGDCSIQTIKSADAEARSREALVGDNQIRSIDRELLAASGKEQEAEPDLTGAREAPKAEPKRIVRQVKLDDPARARAEPFIIKTIRRTR